LSLLILKTIFYICRYARDAIGIYESVFNMLFSHASTIVIFNEIPYCIMYCMLSSYISDSGSLLM